MGRAFIKQWAPEGFRGGVQRWFVHLGDCAGKLAAQVEIDGVNRVVASPGTMLAIADSAVDRDLRVALWDAAAVWLRRLLRDERAAR